MIDVYRSAKGFQVSSGVLENFFGGAALLLPPRRCNLDPKYFDVQMTCYANFREACGDFQNVTAFESVAAVNAAVSMHTH